MKIALRVGVILVFCVCLGCKYDNLAPSNDNASLIGHWNMYAYGSGSDILEGVTTGLTIAYESGIAFSKDGKFSNRYYNSSTHEWTETLPHGNFIATDKVITLTYFPGTKDELKIDLQIIKLDTDHLWITQNYFGPVMEFHLARTN